jgi:hypothetical protein
MWKWLTPWVKEDRRTVLSRQYGLVRPYQRLAQHNRGTIKMDDPMLRLRRHNPKKIGRHALRIK